ncbi:MAG: SDR family NAD(P)-dependent oxidoreductase [Anaerolineaceae bacterium]|mgnify:FL=1|nr:SDR family NAD(P)-dependent oxidoreductase [Anaerolineaceae bacterium]
MKLLPDELQYIQNSLKKQNKTDARLDGKTCVITGATSGVGYQSARQLAKAGARLVLLCRNPEKARKVQDELRSEFKAEADIFIADMRILAEVGRAAKQISEKYPKIDILVNNAGVFNKRRRLTPDGNEEIFGVIHLAAFVLTTALLPNLKAAAPARIIEVNSEAHRFGGLKMNDLDWSRRFYIPLQAYGAAKIAQLLTGLELAERLRSSGVSVFIMHPGAVRTNIGMNNNFLYRFYNRYVLGLFLRDPAVSGEAVRYLAAAPELAGVTGKYFNRTIEENPASYVLNQRLQREIWDYSENIARNFLGAEYDI